MSIHINHRRAIFAAGIILLLLFLSIGSRLMSPANADSNKPTQSEPPSIQVYQPTVEPQKVDAPSMPIPAQAIIQFDSNTTEQERAAYVQSVGGTVVKQIDSLDTVVVSVSQDIAQAPLPESPVVAGTEPDYYVSALDLIPNDPRYAEQWALPAIGAPSAWGQMSTDAPKVTVAVIDSGVCASHPDLAGRILGGWDFLENDAVPQDDSGHGCAVSGVIAANMNDAIGIAGVAPNTQIMPLRVLDASGIGSYSDVAAAIVYAADNGAQVINLSLGGSNSSSTLENAVNYAISKGVIVVAAAGNNGTEGALYPAAYPDVIAVGSVDPNLQHSSFSNYGSQIDILAPGRDILTIKRDGSYGLVSGTSFAAPYVAGAQAISLYLGKTINLDGSIINLSGPGIVSTVSPTPLADITSTPNTNTQLIIDFDRIVNLPLDLHQPLYDFLSTIKLPTTNLTVSAYRNQGEWSEIVVVPTYVVDEHWEVQLQQDNMLRIIADNRSGTWKIYLENHETVPFLSKVVPQSFIDYSNTIENLADTDEYLFPWPAGETWLRTDGWHPERSEVYPNDLDFAPTGSDTSVLAAITGRLEIICGEPPSPKTDSEEVQLAIADSATAQITAVYLHIAANTVERSQLGQLVRRGRLIGSLYGAPQVPFNTPCGHGSGRHLHFEIPNRTLKINGIDINSIGTNSAHNPPYTSSNTKLDSSGIVACQQPYFLGACEKFVLSDTDLTNNLVGNDKIRSIFVPAHWGIKLWENVDPSSKKGGACLDLPATSLDTGIEDLSRFIWTDCGLGGSIGSKIVDTNGVSSVSAIEVTMGPNNSCIASVEALCGGPTPTPLPIQPTATLPPPSGGIEIVSVSSHVVKPGEQFNPSITIRRLSGEWVANRDHLHAIPEDTSNTFGAHPVQPIYTNIPIGGTYTFDVKNNDGFRMTAPSTPGQYQSVWQLRVGGNHIGPQAVIHITVKSDPIVPNPTPLPINCDDPPDGITLYEFVNFQGRCINFPTQFPITDVSYLGNTYFGDEVATSLRVVGNWGVTLFRDPDWNGTREEFTSSDNVLSDNQIGDNQVSSLRVWHPDDRCATLPPGVTLYRDRDFSGFSQTFTQDVSFFGNEPIGDNNINSMRICGNYRVTLYRDPDWQGLSQEFTGKEYNSLTDFPINQPHPEVSSLRIEDINDPCNSLPSGVTLYTEKDFGGKKDTFTSDEMFLGNIPFGDNAARSLRVCGHWTVTLFRDPDWKGVWENFTQKDSNLLDNPVNNQHSDVSSLRMVDSFDFCRTLPQGVTLYGGRDFGGISKTFTQDVMFLGNEQIGDNTVNSMRLCGYNVRLFRDPDWQGFSQEFTGREYNSLTDYEINQPHPEVSSIRVSVKSPEPPTPTPTITPSPTPLAEKPDLIPFQGVDWALPLIPSSVSGDHQVGTLYASQITYLDWGIFNNSSVNVTAPFKVKLFFDGTQINEFSYTSLDANSYHGIDDWNIYVDSPGYHTLKISVDSNNEIVETNDNNNSWEGQFFWNPVSASASTSVSLAGLNVGESALVTASLNNVPAEGYTSAEFTCTYDTTLLEVSNITVGPLFGADAVAAINGPQGGSFIVAMAGINGNKATTGGAALTFNATALQVGQTSVECTARVSKGDGSLTSLPSMGSVTLTIGGGTITPPFPSTHTFTSTVTETPTPSSTSTPTASQTPTPSSTPTATASVTPSQPLIGTLTGQVLATEPVIVRLYDATYKLIVSIPANPDGTFSLTAPPGTYTVVASASGFLSAQKNSTTITGGNATTLPPINLLAGDIDNNGVIDAFDALTIGMNYNTITPSAADLNNDGVINVLDLELLAKNYKKTGPIEWQ